jgi:tetratricopeptide (TPR) repeat protein
MRRHGVALCLAAWLLPGAAAGTPPRAEAPPADVAGPLPEAPAEEGPVEEPRPEYAARLERAWLAGGSLEERAERVAALAAPLGVPNLEPAARAALQGRRGGVPAARAAVRLAPDLPAARAELARRLLGEGRPLAAAAEAARAVGALARHLEGRLWLAAVGHDVLARALLGAGCLFLAVAAVRAARHAAHDLGDLATRSGGRLAEQVDLPGFARTALLICALALPALLGEGPFGLVLALSALVLLYGRGAERAAAGLAVLLVLAGLHPVADGARAARARAGGDPVLLAAHAGLRSLPSAADLGRLARAGPSRGLPLEALALAEKREGRFAQAAAHLLPLAMRSQDPRLLNNGANLALLGGDLPGAILLYERAAAASASVIPLVNLSQAYGRAIRLGEQEAALARAQGSAPRAVTEILARQADAPGGVLDLPIDAATLAAAVATPPLEGAGAPALRARVAPGPLGREPRRAAGACAGIGLAVVLGSRAFRRSASCRRCGVRMCPRCDQRGGEEGLCEACTRLLERPETTDPGLRSERLAAVRERRRRARRWQLLVGALVPGGAGLVGERALAGLAAALAFAGALACAAALDPGLPDPGSLGGAARLAPGLGAAVCGLAYLGLTAAGLRRSGGGQ